MNVMSESHAQFRLLSHDDLRNQARLVRQQRLRSVLMVAFLLAGVFSMGLGLLPLYANQATPILWVYEAEQHGFTEQLKDNGLRLLANGRIQVLPAYFSWVTGIIGTFFLWMGFLMLNSRKDARWFGGAFSREYWTRFYGLKPHQETLIHVKGTPSIRRKRESQTAVKGQGRE